MLYYELVKLNDDMYIKKFVYKLHKYFPYIYIFQGK